MSEPAPTRRPKPAHRIPPPRSDRPPLVANLFEVMQRGNTQLLPLFPYLHPGAIVAAGALFRGGPNKSYGQFFHHNTVDEVVVAFATNGSLLQTGQVFVGGRVHGVNSFMKDEKNPASFGVMCIAQRQAEQGTQTEAYEFRCTGCRERIFFGEFDATPHPDAREDIDSFETLAIAPALLRDFNESAELRTCSKCGHQNAPFPLTAWGWDKYAECSQTAREARELLLKAGAASNDSQAG